MFATEHGKDPYKVLTKHYFLATRKMFGNHTVEKFATLLPKDLKGRDMRKTHENYIKYLDTNMSQEFMNEIEKMDKLLKIIDP
jgi:hypothetical protein